MTLLSSDVTSPMEVISSTGEMNHPDDWHPTTIPSSDDRAFVVAILGPQASGKSTLANHLFSTQFPVASRGAIASATTRGILVSHLFPIASRPHTIVLDVEGADARSRGRNAKAFASRCAKFVAALADVVIVNLWFHDACRLESAAYSAVTAVLAKCAQGIVDGENARTAILIVIRDVDDESPDAIADLTEMIIHDIEEIWDEVALEATLPVGGTNVSDVVDLQVIMFPHIRHQAADFNTQVDSLRDALFSGGVSSNEDSKGIPASGFSTYASTIWESLSIGAKDIPYGIDDELYAEHKIDNYFGGQDFAIVAAFRCDEIFSSKLAEASGDIADLLDEVEQGNAIDDLGRKCDDIVKQTLEQYDAETSDYVEEEVYERKRTELIAILDTGLMSVYLKNLGIISREALAAFKTSIAEEMPADFALHTADAYFERKAKEGIRQGSPWKYETERVDLRNTMNDIASQQRELVKTQITASQQQTKAISFLRVQQAQMRAVQQQALGGSVGQWSLGAAYRPPDSIVNLSLAYQQGRTNLQVSMVPEESSTLLGPSGFTAGVGPGNLGMSFNVNF